MLERYFVKPQTVDLVRASWLGEEIERYVVWLSENNYRDRTVYRRVPLLRQFGEFAWRRGARTVDSLPKQVSPFVESWLETHGTNRSGDRARQSVYNEVSGLVQQFLRVVLPGYTKRGRGPTASIPFSKRAPGFFDYLREERGLRKSSIGHYGHFLRRFEAYLNHIELYDLSALSPAVLSGFVVNCSRMLGSEGSGKPLSRSLMSGLCSTLRVFLRYLFRERLVPRDLSPAVESPQRYRLSDIPRSISWDEVRRVLEVIDRRTSLGKRDYAILLLMVTYGLRAREIAALTLDHIDWRRERLRVPERKAGHSTAYPLSSVVGGAIAVYLQDGRPETLDRHVFLRVLAPYTPMGAAGFSCRASYYLHKAGIDVVRAGSHTFRHTCVQRLVDGNLSFKTIGDYVGHRSVSSTEIYTKIMVEALREVALGDGEELL